MPTNPQDESTPHDPQNPYAESKSRAHEATVRARDEDGLFAAVGVLYNHESPLRPPQFVTRKITRAAAEIAEGLTRHRHARQPRGVARLGCGARLRRRDARCPAAVGAVGLRHRDGQAPHAGPSCWRLAFAAVGIDDPWPHVEQDPALLRKADAPGLSGDASKARARAGLVTDDDVRGPRTRDGRRRPEAPEVRHRRRPRLPRLGPHSLPWHPDHSPIY